MERISRKKRKRRIQSSSIIIFIVIIITIIVLIFLIKTNLLSNLKKSVTINNINFEDTEKNDVYLTFDLKNKDINDKLCFINATIGNNYYQDSFVIPSKNISNHKMLIYMPNGHTDYTIYYNCSKIIDKNDIKK
jgi:hypothetical protein